MAPRSSLLSALRFSGRFIVSRLTPGRGTSINSTLVVDIASSSGSRLYTTREATVNHAIAFVALTRPSRRAHYQRGQTASSEPTTHPRLSGGKGGNHGDRRDCRAQGRRPQHRTHPRKRQG